MATVFISHSSANQDKAEELLNKLESAGISCWFAPRDIPPGAAYSSEIPKAIGECTYFVLLLSNEAQNSPFVMLELDQAIKRRKEILPMALEQMDQNESTNFLINAKQAVDATKDFDGAVKKIIKTISDNFRNPDADSLHIKERRMVDCTKEICCPHCGCTVLKKDSFSMDRYFLSGDTDEKVLRFEKIMGFLKKNELGAWLVMMATVLSGAVYATAIAAWGPSIFLAVVGFIVVIVVKFLSLTESVKCYGALKRVKVAVAVSGLRYQSLKCAGCEEKFTVLLPEKGELKDWIPELIETDTKELPTKKLGKKDKKVKGT